MKTMEFMIQKYICKSFFLYFHELTRLLACLLNRIIKLTDMQPTYLPIDPDFFNFFEKEMQKDTSRIVYFGEGTNLEEVNGKIDAIVKKNGNEYFMKLETEEEVRVDRIIVYNGKPGPAFDEYDAYALECLSCKAGYEED